MRTKATLKNISQSLNLSISTVSRALKNHPDISEETKQKVMELATLLEYEPNTHAINLRTNRSKIFGLIVPVISNYFYHSFIASVEEDARKLGYSLLILQSGDDPMIELENLKLCRLNRVAGVFVSITSLTKDIKPFLKLDEFDIPVIFFDKVPSFEACNKICLADAEAAALAAQAVIAKNKKMVLAIYGNAELSITQKRQKAFASTLSQSATGIQLLECYASTPEEAEKITREYCIMTNKPDTIFGMSDEILTGIMRSIQKMKLSVPGDIAIISICNNNFIPSLYEPTITYVETSGLDLGKLALKRMMDHLGGKTFVQELTVPSRLVEGGSL
ncbi:MAG: LacI family DNA-binding transcriptional regulator [Chitinophagaceae bacterium]|nr:LacI family DNA-binding transcriptional regulator [Chitinophagaceae bacterium]